MKPSKPQDRPSAAFHTMRGELALLVAVCINSFGVVLMLYSGAGISAILDGETPEFTWDESNATLGVVIASNGYPENVIKGARVPEIEVDEDSHVYYAGVASDEHGNLVANSGRVLLVETSAPDIKSAQDKVYAIIDKLELRGLFYRHDIGFKALK